MAQDPSVQPAAAGLDLRLGGRSSGAPPAALAAPVPAPAALTEAVGAQQGEGSTLLSQYWASYLAQLAVLSQSGGAQVAPGLKVEEGSTVHRPSAFLPAPRAARHEVQKPAATGTTARRSGDEGSATDDGDEDVQGHVGRSKAAGGGVMKCSKEKNRQAQRRFRERQKALIINLRESVKTLTAEAEEQAKQIYSLQEENRLLKTFLQENHGGKALVDLERRKAATAKYEDHE